jgi:NAD(P)H-flavin reductase/hemoglobin-like flavoprotein
MAQAEVTRRGGGGGRPALPAPGSGAPTPTNPASADPVLSADLVPGRPVSITDGSDPSLRGTPHRSAPVASNPGAASPPARPPGAYPGDGRGWVNPFRSGGPIAARTTPGPTFGPMPGGVQGPADGPYARTGSGVSGVGGIPGGPWLPRVGHTLPGEAVVQPGTVAAPVRHNGSVPAPTAGTALPRDGMDSADAAALHEVQRLLGNSLSLAGGPDEVAGRLRAALAQAQPQLLAALPGSPISQREQLAAALTWLVHHLDDPPLLVGGCTQLGAALAECGVPPQQLQLIGAALAEAMRAGMATGGWRQDFDLAWRSTWQHVHEWIVHGETTTGYEPTRWTAAVVSHELRRPDLAVVRLRPYLPMPFRPGQYARIEVPELPGVWRPYSLAGAPRRDNVVELHVRAKTGARVSGTLVYRTKRGDKLRLARAEGAMVLPERPDRDLLLIAGDTGVAPLKALLTELAATDDPRSAVLFWGARTLDELYDIEEITEIARACRRATVVPVISEGNSGPYASGLVTDAVAAYGQWSGHEVYLAGPPLMLAATSAALQLLGVPPEQIHHDAPEG